MRRRIHPTAALFRGMMRVVPVRHRFPLALRIASLPAPVLSRLGLGRGEGRCPVESARDFALVQILWKLSDWRVRYDRVVHVEGVARLEEARAAGRGVLLAGPHTHLTLAALHELFAAGHDLVAVSMGRYTAPPWESRRIPVILRDERFLLGVRDALLRGEVVFAMIDRAREIPGRTVAIPVAGGTLHAADALLRLAARCGSPVFFAAARAAEDSIACTLAAAPDGAGMEDFASFVQAYSPPPSNADDRAR